MGAAQTWRGPRLRGVASSHDLGGAGWATTRARRSSTPTCRFTTRRGLYVFSGAVFPTCAGVNPHLTLMAITARASRKLIERLGGSVPTRQVGAQA